MSSAPDGTHSGKEDFKLKRFGQVVICAKVKPSNHIGHGIACGEHNNRHRALLRAYASQNRHAIESGQHNVEHNYIKVFAFDQFNSLIATMGQKHAVPVFDQTLP